MKNSLGDIWRDESGATMVEYAIVVALIAGLCAAVIYKLGPFVNGAFVMTAKSMNAQGTGP